MVLLLFCFVFFNIFVLFLKNTNKQTGSAANYYYSKYRYYDVDVKIL